MRKYNCLTVLLGLTLFFLVGAPRAVGEVHSEIRGCLNQLLDDNDANDFTAMSDLTAIAYKHLNEPAPNIQNVLNAYQEIASVNYQAPTKPREMYFLIKATRRGAKEASAADITDTDPNLVSILCQSAEEGLSRGERILATDALKWFVNYSDTTIRDRARQFLEVVINDPAASVRRRAVKSLGEARETDLRGYITPKLSDPAESVKYAAAVALEKIYDNTDSEILGIYRECLESTNVVRRIRSSKYFLGEDDPDYPGAYAIARNNVSQCLTSPRGSIRLLAASYLKELPDSTENWTWNNFFALFQVATESNDPKVRLRGLAALRDREYVPQYGVGQANLQIIEDSDCLLDIVGDKAVQAVKSEACLTLKELNKGAEIPPPNECSESAWDDWLSQQT